MYPGKEEAEYIVIKVESRGIKRGNALRMRLFQRELVLTIVTNGIIAYFSNTEKAGRHLIIELQTKVPQRQLECIVSVFHTGGCLVRKHVPTFISSCAKWDSFLLTGLMEIQNSRIPE